MLAFRLLMGVQICAIPLEGYAELKSPQTLLVVPLPGVCQARVRSHNHKNKFSRTHGGSDSGAPRPVHLHCAMATPCNALPWGTGKPQPYTMAGPNLLSILLGKRSRGWMHTLAHDSSCAMLKKMQTHSWTERSGWWPGRTGDWGDTERVLSGEGQAQLYLSWVFSCINSEKILHWIHPSFNWLRLFWNLREGRRKTSELSLNTYQ